MIEAASQTDRRVTYKALNSETVSAARKAATAAGMSTEEWLTRAILNNSGAATFEAQPPRPGAPAATTPAARSPVEVPAEPPLEASAVRPPTSAPAIAPAESAPGGRPSTEERMEAMARHLRRAKAAADKSGISVSEWLTQAIMESARAQHFNGRAANDRNAPEPSAAAPAGSPTGAIPGVALQPAMDPLQERLARIVAARRHETAREQRNGQQARGQPMLLATRPQPKEGIRRLLPNLDAPRGAAPTISWFWTAVLVILIAIAGLIWSIPYLPEPVPAGRANISPPMDSVTGVVPPKTAKAGDTADPSRTGSQPPENQSSTSLANVERSAMPTPPEQNVGWYKRAAEAGNRHAQYELAKLYIRGTGIDSNPEEAARLLKLAANRGELAEAQYALGVMHERGIGVEKSIVEATLLYQRAADQGYVLALTQVGIALLEGRGVAKDLDKARRFLERAAEAGEMNAQYSLGRMYEQGLGVDKDRIQALKWFILAAQRGHQLATEKFENVSHKISDQERERANDLAREHNERFGTVPN